MAMKIPTTEDLEKRNANQKVYSRACQFDPTAALKLVVYEESGEAALYLPVNERVDWANKYSEEKNIRLLIDECANITYQPETGMYIVTAKVYLDGECVGTGVACVMCNLNDPSANRDIIQKAATKAKGRALANAGFGTFCAQMDGGDSMPVDGGYIISGSTLKVNTSNPMDATLTPPPPGQNIEDDSDLPFSSEPPMSEPAPAAAPAPEPVQQTAASEPAPAASVTEPAPEAPSAPAKKTRGRQKAAPAKLPETLEEAQGTVVDMPGMFCGKTLGEVYAMRKSSVEFWAGNLFKNADKYPALVAASRIICDAFGAKGDR